MPYLKLYILTDLSANDIKFISVETYQNIYTYGTVNSIFVEIQPDSTNIKMTLVFAGSRWGTYFYAKKIDPH